MRELRIRVRSGAVLAAIAVLLPMNACNTVQHDLLEAPDPDVIDTAAINTPEAADAMRLGGLSRLRNITAGGEGAWMLGGLLTDEWKSGDTFSQRNETDQRLIQTNNGNVQTMYRELHLARTNAREALDALVRLKPNPQANLGQMYFVIAFAEMTLAETFCNGQPLSESNTGVVEYGDPLTNQQIFSRALTHFDSAITLAAATDTFSTNVRRASQVGKARVLVNLARFTEAAAALAGVPDTFKLNATFSLTA